MGGKIGVLVDVETDVVNDAVKEMARNVAMQIAILAPFALATSSTYLATVCFPSSCSDPERSERIPETGEGYPGYDHWTYQERTQRDLPS